MGVFLRIWQEANLKDITKNLFVIGELSGECFSCHNLGISLKEKSCPYCNKEFKYIGFRRKIDLNSIKRFRQQFPEALFIDFDDFKKATGKDQARKLLDI